MNIGEGRTARGRIVRSIGVLAAIGAAVIGMSPVLPVDAHVPGSTNQVLVWDAHAYHQFIGDTAPAKQPPPTSAIHLAMVHGAMYDAVNAITGGHQPHLVAPAAEDWYSTEAAAASAAWRVLRDLPNADPSQLDALHAQSLADITDTSDAEAGGVAVGVAAAEAMLQRAPLGGSQLFTVGQGPGDWRPVPPTGNAFAWVASVEPFVIEHASDFATPGPLPLDSAAYAAEFDEVKRLGSKTSTERTADQTATALFWSDHTTAIWARTIHQIASDQQLSTEDTARFLASVHMAGSDALIACFDDKERHHFWRPQTAIREAATDGNPMTAPDTTWEALITNPPYPDHPSGANCLTSGYVHAMREFLGTNRLSFDVTHSNGNTRTFSHLSHAMQEMRLARMYSGLHFMIADSAGVDLGRAVAKYVDRNAFQPA